MTLMLGWPAVDQATLDLPGTDVATAVAGRAPLDDIDCRLVLQRCPTHGWRTIYDGAVPDTGHIRPRILVIAAPEPGGDDTWTTVSFQQQPSGSWSTMGSSGVQPYWYDENEEVTED